MNSDRACSVVRRRWQLRLHGSAGRVAGAVLAGFVVVGLVVFLPLAADPEAAPREIVLVARGMAFYVDGQRAPNPVLTMTAGETVRIVVRNEDVGIAHNFEIPTWDEATPIVYGDATAMVQIKVPSRPGRHDYVCRPHAAMMNGVVDVVSAN